MSKYDVIAMGELLIDFTENGTSDNLNPILEANPGGAPCNVLSMLQKLGKKTAFIGKVGKDSFGDFLTEVVKAQDIDVTYLSRSDEVPTTLAFVHTAPDGDRSFSFYRNPGADMMIREDDIDIEAIKSSKIFHFGTLSMTDENCEKATIKAVKGAKDNDIMISFDPNLRPLLWKDMNRAKAMIEYGIKECDILKISDDEIIFFTGEEDVKKGAIKIFEEYKPKLLCATLGKDGSYAINKNGMAFCEGKVREDTIETTGAGDTFMACTLNYVLENGIDLDEIRLKDMLYFANTAASIITTKKGALRVMPTLEEIKKEL